MKKFFKGLAMLLALTLVIGTIPASAKVYEKKELYLGGAKGTVTVDGVVTAKAKQLGKAKIFKLVGFKKADAAEHEIEAKLADGANEGIVKITDTYVKAKAIGTTSVDIFVDGAKKTTVAFTVKANDTEVELTGLADGETYALNKAYEYTVKGNNGFDKVALKADSENVEITDTTVTFKAEGTYKITAYSYQSDKYTDAIATKAITVEAGAALAAVATGAKQITVTGVTEDATITVKRGNATLTFTKAFADGKAVLTLDSKIRDAEYTVSDGTNSVSFKGEEEKVDQIVIKENGGMVNVDDTEMVAYVHYDVLNQYGESVRKTFVPNFTSNITNTGIKADYENGLIEITNTVKYKYNDFITLVAVYTKGTNSCTASATMNVGLKVAVGEVSVLGVMKKDTTKVLDKLPKDFKNDYYLVYTLNDQNGLPLKWNDARVADLNVTSTNPLVASVAKGAKVSTMLNGVEVGLFEITPGDYAKNGGLVPVLITSTTTGKQITYNMEVTSAQILKSFTFTGPSDIVAEGETVTLEFEAIDTEGDPVTNYRVLYDSLQVSGPIKVKENNDYTAKLTFTAPATGASKNADGYCTATAIVALSGSVCTQQLTYKDAAFVDAITGYEGSTVFVEGKDFQIDYKENYNGRVGHILAVDQYDRTVSKPAEKLYRTNEYDGGAGNCYVYVSTTDDTIIDISGSDYCTDDAGKNWYKIDTATLTACECTTSAEDVVLEFALFGAAGTYAGKILTSSSKKVTFTVVDINKVNNFSVKVDNAKVQNANYFQRWYDGVIDTTGSAIGGNGASVSGMYNGVSVSVPDTYVEYTYNYGGVTAEQFANGEDIALTWQTYEAAADLANGAFYNYSSVGSDGKYGTKGVGRNVKATVKNAADVKLADCSTSYSVLADYRVIAKFATTSNNDVKWGADTTTATVIPTDGVITYATLLGGIDHQIDNYDRDLWGDVSGIEISVYNLVVSDEDFFGVDTLIYGEGQIVASTLSTDGTMLEDVEIGDTFIVEYSHDNASIKATVTVGADKKAYIGSGYMWR